MKTVVLISECQTHNFVRNYYESLQKTAALEKAVRPMTPHLLACRLPFSHNLPFDTRCRACRIQAEAYPSSHQVAVRR